MAQVPTFDEMMNPLIQALNELGGSGTIEELNDKVADILNLSDEQLEVLHNPKSGLTEVSYRLAWTRTYLKKFGILDNKTRGVWELTKTGQQIDSIDPRRVKRFVVEQDREARAKRESIDSLEEEAQNTEGDPILKNEETVVANQFKGFTVDTFAFMEELGANNNKQWMKENHGRWKESVREPMRALFADLGPHLKPKFDPFLLPDALETRPTAHQILSRINKNWSATPESLYHDYFWGAFYREGLTRQTDAQLFITLYAHVLRFGFYVGQLASPIRDQFRRRVQDSTNGFYALITGLELTNDFDFVRREENDERVNVAINSASDLKDWLRSNDYDLLIRLNPEEAVTLGAALADRIYNAMRRVFPVFLWAVVDDPEQVIEHYLAAEFAVADPDLDDEVEPVSEPYSEVDFLEKTYLMVDMAVELRETLMDHKQAMFFGPPGTGKTFVAQHLGRLITGLADPPVERMQVIQFHPAYSYEEFIEGIRPEAKQENGRYIIDYPAKSGAFVNFCQKARNIDGPCVFIIDEINRGNIARIFGELMLLLEYRDQEVTLPYSGKSFSIPKNVYVIGTMNTADRSIALVDFALRRRFQFFHFAADPDLFERWLRLNPTEIVYLSTLYRRLSQDAIDDPNFAIGPSHFISSLSISGGIADSFQETGKNRLRN